MGKFLKILGMFALMTVCGVIAYGVALTYWMGLGSKYHDNYEYYATYLKGYPVLASLVLVGSIGFFAPALIIWHLKKNSWRFRVRDLLIAMTLVAALLALYATSL